jgi:hypothetical protein
VSNRRKVRAARPFPLPRPGEEMEIAFMPGATIHTKEAIAAMQKQTHDGLIELLDQYRAFLAEYGDESVLVVAECDAVR